MCWFVTEVSASNPNSFSPSGGASWGCTWWSPISSTLRRETCGSRVNTAGSSACRWARRDPLTAAHVNEHAAPVTGGNLPRLAGREAKQTCEHGALHTCGTADFKQSARSSPSMSGERGRVRKGSRSTAARCSADRSTLARELAD